MTEAKKDDEMNLYEVHAATKRGAAVHLLFRDEGRAKSVLALLHDLREPETVEDRRGLGPNRRWDPVVRLEDDYGSVVVLDRNEIALAWFDDMGQNAEGQAEKQLFAARANVRLQKKAQQDPVLRAAQQPPAIVAARPDLLNSSALRQ